MTKKPLPLVDSTRMEFGFERTICDCDECKLNCRYLPGYLIPADLDRVRFLVAPNQDLFEWARKHLLASPGAKVMSNGRLFRIPTLVPARKAEGGCIFLTGDGGCGIHAVAPFGCAFFDHYQLRGEADRRSLRGLEAVAATWADGEVYAQVWLALDGAGLKAPAPERCRTQLRESFPKQKQR
jgi:hypothetical protein